MQAPVELPKAFSVRDEHEFFPIQHLLERLNPRLTVSQVATGKHVAGGCTVYWGMVYLEGSPPGEAELHAALKEAGFDFLHNGSIPALSPVRPGAGRGDAILDFGLPILDSNPKSKIQNPKSKIAGD